MDIVPTLKRHLYGIQARNEGLGDIYDPKTVASMQAELSALEAKQKPRPTDRPVSAEGAPVQELDRMRVLREFLSKAREPE